MFQTCHVCLIMSYNHSSEMNSPRNNSFLSRSTIVESNLTSVTCLFPSEYIGLFQGYTPMEEGRLPGVDGLGILVSFNEVFLGIIVDNDEILRGI